MTIFAVVPRFDAVKNCCYSLVTLVAMIVALVGLNMKLVARWLRPKIGCVEMVGLGFWLVVVD